MAIPRLSSLRRLFSFNLLRSLLRPLSKPSSEGYLTLQFTEDEWRLVLIASGKPVKKETTQFFNFRIGEQSEEAVIEKVKQALADLGVRNPRLVGVVPSLVAITRNIEIPSRNPEEIREIVNLQAGRHTPYSRNEIVVDYLSLGVFKNIYTKVLLVIVPRTQIKRFYDVAEKLKFQIEKIVFAPEAMMRNAVRHLKLDSERLPVGFIHLDRATTEFLVASKGLVLFMRNIPVGAGHFSEDPENTQARLIDELKKSLEAYQSENIDQNPSLLILTGVSRGVPLGLDAVLSEELRAKTKAWSYQEAIPFGQEVKSNLLAQPVSFWASVASVTLFEELSVDLIPEENKLKRSVDERSREVIKTGILAMVCLTLASAVFVSHLYFKKAEIVLLNQRFEPIRKEAKKFAEAYDHIQLIKSHLAMRGRSVESLGELYGAIPKDMYLTEIRYDEGKKFSVKGTAAARGSIFAFVGNLEDSLQFRNVEAKYVSGKTVDGKELSDFEIVAAFE